MAPRRPNMDVEEPKEPIENFLDIPLSLTLYFDDPDEINYVGPTRLRSPLQ